MTRLIVIALFSLLVAGVLVYGAMRTAERIARKQQQQIERTIEE